MTKERLFEFAKEKGWDKVLEVCRTHHSLSEIEARVNKRVSYLLIELRAMCALGLMQLVKKGDGGYAYAATELGLEFLKSKNV